MDVKALETFEVIVRTGSFVKAAQELKYVQSTVTSQIQKLEEDLGNKLFIRGRRIQLTEAGEVLHLRANDLLQHIDQIYETMRKISTGYGGHVRFGAMESIATTRIRDLLIDFCREHPDVKLTLEVGSPRIITQNVVNGALDFAICSAPELDMGLRFRPLFEESMAVLLPSNHELVAKSKLYCDDLVGHRILLRDRNCPFRRELEQHLVARGQNPFSGLEIGDSETLVSMVKNGIGIAVLPTVYHQQLQEGVVQKEFEDFAPSLTIGLIQKQIANLSPTVESFIKRVSTCLRVPIPKQ